MQREENHFCHFFVRKNTRHGCYTAGTKTGFSAMRMAFVLRGQCLVQKNDGSTLLVEPGDLWFLPKESSYVSNWRSDDEVTFYTVEFDVDHMSLYYSTMQVLHMPALSKNFEVLHTAWEQEDTFGCLSALYGILHHIFSSLQKNENEDIDRILPALNYLRDNAYTRVRVEEAAALCYLSPSRFFEVFRKAIGETPIQYKNKIRLTRAEILLREGKSVQEVCDILHFSSPSFLRRMMKKHLGITPREAKKSSI
ncbi:MAG: helix-turn-helix transcriptional regulator [Clostridia bacterium]|nr:helix-turn-helix transcriptional regulator [Clostridia bacterium]